MFRNTELIYSNEVSSAIAEMGRHRAVICEGIDELLAHRSPNYVYVPPGGPAKIQSGIIFHSQGSIALPFCPAFTSEFGMYATNIEFTPLG